MWFIGKYQVGKSVASLEQRSENLKKERERLTTDVSTAIEARNTVISQIGEEITKLKAL